MKLRVGDTIQVIAGSEKGKTGEILAIKGNRVVVEGVKKVNLLRQILKAESLL